MAWLLHDDHVLATLEIAEGVTGRARGLLGRSDIEGAMLLSPARSIHTVRMRFPIDAAWCDAEMRILRLRTLRPNRLSRPCLKARCVIEAEAGAFDRWGVTEGDVLDVRR
jgi:uncharacterized membrane protein (UPF0127 family)